MKKLLAFLLSGVCALSLFGCGGQASSGGEQGGDNGASEPQNPYLTNPVVCLNEFETQKDLNTIGMQGCLGKVQINKDELYTKSGEGSAKVTVIHNPHDYRDTPLLFQDVTRLDTGEDYTDFSKISDITMWVYNANATEEQIGMQLYYAGSTSLVTWFDLEPEQWTKVRYTVSREDIPVVNFTGENSSYVNGVNLVFARPQGTEDKVFYLDEFCLYRTAKPVVAATKTLKPGEISSFDSYWQIGELSYIAGAYAPIAEWVKDVTVDGTGAAVKLTALPGAAAEWPGIRYGQAYLKQIEWTEYSGEDRIHIYIYLPKNQSLEISIGLLYGGNVICGTQTHLVPGEWNHFTWTVDEINEISATKHKGYKLTSITSLDICYRPFGGKDTKTLYVDNIYMERVTTKEAE